MVSVNLQTTQVSSIPLVSPTQLPTGLWLDKGASKQIISFKYYSNEKTISSDSKIALIQLEKQATQPNY